MLARPEKSGKEKAGFIQKTREDGFSGIAGTIWADEYQTKMSDKSNAGKRWLGMSRKFVPRAGQGMSSVAPGSDKRCCTGHTIVERYNNGADLTE